MSYPRHTLCYLDKTAQAISRHSDHEQAFLTAWIAKGFPLITTRQPPSVSEEQIQLAIPAVDPLTQQKIRMRYLLSKSAIQKHTLLPSLSELFPQIPKDYPFIRVYGSYCWQYLTNHITVRPDSDLDLLIDYTNQSIASLAALHPLLAGFISPIKIDGEVRFPQLGDCSYIELIHKQEIPTLLFKSEQGVELISRDYLYARFPALPG